MSSNPPDQQTKLLHLSDMHLGFHLRGTHSDAGGSTPPWHKSLTPTEAFEASLAIARQERVDAVIHTGDLFDHNVDQPTLDRAVVALESLAEASIPFYCILGDHDRNATGGAFPGDVNALATLADVVDKGVVTLLGRTPARVGTVALYGIDADNIGLDTARSGQYTLDFWEDPALSFDSPPPAIRSVLCLHERVAPPYSLSEDPDCLLDVYLPDNEPSFDLVAVGHEHGPRCQDPWRDGTVTYAGPTERFSSQWPDLQPSVSIITVPSAGDIKITAHLISEQFAGAQDGLYCSSTRAQ
jgi:DNA repair exonuclease SbcCD nuclease subunit